METLYFKKVSFEQYKKAHPKMFDVSQEVDEYYLQKEYDRIKLPVRATDGSAGYDFFMPTNINIRAGVPVTIDTGISCVLDDGWVLFVLPRSSLGFKYGMRLVNTVGVIDADFWRGETEGNILVRFVSDVDFCLNEGDRFVQGIILQHGTTSDDAVKAKRTGGVGSTGI